MIHIINKKQVKNISPTDISQFIRLEQCERYLRLRLHEKTINNKFMLDYGVAPQSISPLLSFSGSDFETEVEEQVIKKFPIINFETEDPSRQRNANNNKQIIGVVAKLLPGQVIILFKSRLYIELDGWQFSGEADLIRLERDENGLLYILVVDMKSSTSVKVEHRLQVAFYQVMLESLFEQSGVSYTKFDIGILYAGPADIIKTSSSKEHARYEKEIKEATRLLGTKDSFLEIILDQQAYLDSIYDLVTSQHSTAHRVISTDFERVPYSLSYKCDSCLYNEFCMKWSAEHDDLSLLPYMSSQDKNALKNAGINTIKDVALLKDLRKVVSSLDNEAGLVTSKGKESLVKRIAATWPVGHRLDELIYRAKRYRNWKKDNIEFVDYIPTKGQGSLPYSDRYRNPNLVKVYIDAQHDYLQDRMYLLSSLVVCYERGQELPQRRKFIYHATNEPPKDATTERNLFIDWIDDTVKAIVELASPDQEGKKRAPIHIIFFNSYEQRILLDGLARNFSAVLGATPFYDFMTQLAAFDSPMVTFLDEEIRDLKNYPMVCQSLHAVAAYLKFDWNKGEKYREIFQERVFDFWSKLGEANGLSAWYTNHSRFSSQVPLEYAYSAWDCLPVLKEQVSDPFAPYRGVKLEQLKGFQLRRLEAIECVTKDFKGNDSLEKQPFNLPDLARFTDKARTLAAALDEFLTIERHVELTSWKTAHYITPERRVLMGETLLVSYHDSDQSPEVASQNKENERRRLLAEQYRNSRSSNLTKQEKLATEWSQVGLIVRLRIENLGVDCDLEEILSLTKIEEGNRLILYPRLVHSKLVENKRAEVSPIPKNLLYGTRADVKRLIVVRDDSGRAKSACIEVELQTSFKTIERGYAFKSADRPLIDGKYYTLDSDPNNYYGYWCAEVTEALCRFEQGEAIGRNTLYDRLTNSKESKVFWPTEAQRGQARFLAGLDSLKEAEALHEFESSKRAYISSHGNDPILLVQGPPGTGKSYSTAFAIFARLQGAMAAGIKFHVYVACKTHAATDVLLENIRKVQEKLLSLSESQPRIFFEYFDKRLINIPIFRIAPKDNVPNGVIALAKERNKGKGEKNNVDELSQYTWAIVATPPGGIRDMVRGKWKKSEGLLGHYFCNCLVLDEASQMNLPEAIMAALPLHPEGQLIVVGDHRQMPPIVHHSWDLEPRRTFQEYKTYESLFTTLLTLEPPMIKFEESFRLHTVMAEFLREEIYWRDGIDYHSNKIDLIAKLNHENEFVASVLACEHPMVVIVHDESESQTRNAFEQELITPILKTLSDKNLYGFNAKEGIGVVVPHRMQRAALQLAFPFLEVRDDNSGETRSAIDTVERFQGGERTVILVSVTESDREYLLASSKFLLDPRRLTVAMSRAKEKLILIASRAVFSLFDPDEETFINLQMWKSLLRHHCTHALWQGEFLGKNVEVWGTEPTEVISKMPIDISLSSSQTEAMKSIVVIERKPGVQIEQLKAGVIIRGPIFAEPVQVIATIPMGNSVKLFAKGLHTNQVHEPILNAEQLGILEATPEKEAFNGEAEKFRLAIEAARLGLAYEYDPYFSLSIARVDPLPHQLEAVYDYFIKLPRIRFLLADDPGAGKTVMAGLLLKELKIRGLVKRTLIVTPANLSFQWQREMSEKFRETFKVVRSDILRANYGSNPWQEENQVITSVSWASRVEDAKESLLRSHWDLIIVDEAHKMSAYSSDKKTLTYQLGEKLSEMTDHYLLMTATPHKGDPENFCLFLELLDKDIYGDVSSLEEAMKRNSAPFYLRRTKEALVSFPDPTTGQVKKLFTNRKVDTIEFRIDSDEWDFYDALTRYVEDQSIKAAEDNSVRGRAISFTMAMLQRRFASSVYAVRRSLERMREKRQEILKDPEKYKKEQINKRLPDEFDELPEDEQKNILEELESVVASYNPTDLREEIQKLDKLIGQARTLEKREIETKLLKLKVAITDKGIFTDPKMKLLIFTEHKDTLDYLAGDGKDGRPFGKLREWGLTVTQIHGGMKIGDRDTPNTRIYSEREFREDCQVLIATEAAGEGINLQFCWFMINYDIPWNPVRLEQRMGRIHRYGQEKDCLIFNFVSTNTREGRVLQKLFERIKKIEEDLDPNQTGKVFNVLGDIFPSNQLERMIRDMYAHNLKEDVILNRIVAEVDTERFRKITDSTLEGLAKRELNLSSIIGRSAEARERRLVPEAIKDFFIAAAPIAGIIPKEAKAHSEIYRVGRVPRPLWTIGDRLEPRFGKLGREYKQVVFDKKFLLSDGTLEWITPGHPLFECVREEVSRSCDEHLKSGAVFFDINCKEPKRLDVFSASIRDGRNNVLHKRLFVVQTSADSSMEVCQPTIFWDLISSPTNSEIKVPDDNHLPNRHQVEQYLIEKALEPFLAEIKSQREKEVKTISEHLEISLNAIINRVQCQFAELMDLKESGSKESGLEGRTKQIEDRLSDLNHRLDNRRDELRQERNCTIADINHYGRAWVMPHPERKSPEIAPIVQDEDIERIAVDAVIAYEEARGWQVESVEKDNKGFDLISRRPHPEDPKTAIEVRFIEVKGRSEQGQVALTTNEYRTAGRLGQDYWLYIVYNCINKPEINTIQNPAQLNWQPLVKIEHYYLNTKDILNAKKENS